MWSSRGQQQTVQTPQQTAQPTQQEYVSRSGRHWQLTAPSSQVCRGPHNIIRQLDGPRGDVARATEIAEVFKAFLTCEMVDIIVEKTNK